MVGVADATGGSVTLLTVGPQESTDQLRNLLAQAGCQVVGEASSGDERERALAEVDRLNPSSPEAEELRSQAGEG